MLIYNIRMSVGTNIKKRRYELKMSQNDLAKAMGYKTRSTIAKIESDENSISYKKLLKFADILHTSVDTLISGTNATYSNTSIIEDNTNENKCICIILAGGKSTRNQQNIPNQFLDLFGKPVIVYSLEAYQKHPLISQIYVVCLKGWESILMSYIKQYNITKFVTIIPGGEDGITSIKNAINKIKKDTKDDDIIVFQESTRPMVTQEMISNTILNTQNNGSAIMCEKMDDYLQFKKNYNTINYIDRNTIVSIQSPESYKFSILKKTYHKKSHSETCCAMFMYNNGYKLNLISGYTKNIKIIKQEDIDVASVYIKKV